jgi:hypothetical protein
MNTQVDENIETIYDDYQEEAKRVNQDRMRAFNKYRWGGLIGCLFMILALFGILPRPAFWGGAFIIVIAIGLGIFAVRTRGKKEAEKSAKSRPGFTEFYKRYSDGRYWPYQIVPGEKYEKFLTIIGRKGSE